MAKIITANLVKELRERTGVGIMECKKSLVEAVGDIELAISNMRKAGKAKAANKAGRLTTEGKILSAVKSKYGVILELNCETDFVARSSDFQSFGEEILAFALSNISRDLEFLQTKFEEKRTDLVAKVGENIHLRRVFLLEGDTLNYYMHGTRIGVLLAADKNADKDLMKHIAMHIAASNPGYIKPEDVPENVIEREYQIQLGIAIQSGKSPNIAEKMVKGRMRKFVEEVSLTRQKFILNLDKTVSQILEEKKNKVTGFIRFEVGEGI